MIGGAICAAGKEKGPEDCSPGPFNLVFDRLA